MASSIVTSAARQLGTLLVEEAKYLYAVSDKIKDLQSELEWMQCFLEDADNRQHQEKVVRKWVAEIRDFAYEAEDLIERYVHEVSHPQRNGIWNTISWFSCLWDDALVLHDIGSRMDDLSTKITKLISRLQVYGIQIIRRTERSTYNFAMREKRRTYSHVEEKTVGLENHIKEVVDRLVKGDEVKVVSIAGIGGLGKTTLARKVYSDTRVKESFKNRVWVYVSKQFDRRNVFEEILIGLSCSGEDDDSRKRIKELTNEELPKKICKVLEDEGCLVLLDDIWTNEAWDTLKPAFESIRRSSSKILITTRNMELAGYADPFGYTHPLGILDEEDGWKLLQQTAFIEENNSDAEVKAEMKELGKKMLNHCKGLPLAIVALGGILANKRTFHDWETVSNNITYYLSDEVREGGGDKVLSVLELSYDELPFYLKPCFLYLGCFPEDSEIPTDKLYHLWEAEGLVTMSADEKVDIRGVSLDDIAESYLNQLVNRSMVQVEKRWPNGSIVSCRLHDVMRDMCLNKCREVNFHEISTSINRKSRRHAIYTKDGSNLGDHSFLNEAPYIRSLLVFADKKDGDQSLEELLSQNTRKFLSLLRVFYLDGLPMKDGVPVISHCLHLRYLSLRGNKNTDVVIDYIWDCKYLESLDLRNDDVTWRGPFVRLSNELWKLGRLRHLYLPSRFSIVDSSKLRLTLNQLRQIETFENFDIGHCKMEDLSKMENLRSFSFGFYDNFIENKEDLGHLIDSPAIRSGHLKSPLALKMKAKVMEEDTSVLTSSSLKLICINSLHIQGRIKDEILFPRSLRKLRLQGCEMTKEGIMEAEKLPHLEELVLEGEVVRGTRMSFSPGSFKNLLKLTLFIVPNLEEWEVGEGALPNLVSLVLFFCAKLKRIPEGLPASMKIYCDPPINGCENYVQGNWD